MRGTFEFVPGMMMQKVIRNTKSGAFAALRGNEKLRIALVLTACYLMVVVSLIFFAVSIGKPYLGVNLSLTSQGWIVQSVDGNGLASEMGVKQGDKPVQINGQSADVVLQKYVKSGTVFGQAFQQFVVVDAQGHYKTVDLETGILSWQSVAQQIALLITSIILWLVGFYVFLKRPNNVAALLLCLFGALVGLSLGGNLGATLGVPMAAVLHIVASVIAPWLLMRFMLVLPEENIRLRRERLTYLVYLPAAVTLILLPLIGWKDGQPVQWFRTVRLLEYAAGFLGAAVVAVFNYYHSHSAKTKQQMRIVLLSVLAALIPVLLLNVIPFAIWRQTVIPPGVSILFVAFIPLGMGYVVVVERLMDIDVIIRRSIVYGSITLVMTTILSLALFAALAFPEALNIGQEILLALAAGWLATILFGPTKKWAEILVDRLFYKDRYDYRQIIDALSNSLKLLKDPVEISRVMVGTAVRTLNLAGASLFVKQQSGDFAIGACQGTLAADDMQEKITELTYRRNSLTEFPNQSMTVDPDVQFIIPLITGEKEVGIFFLSHKASRQEFSSDDMYLLQGMASVGAMALHSAMLIRDVSIRDTFVSIASHELRTPLTAVIGYSDLLLRRDPPEATRKQWLKTILDNGTRIAEMADDLLDVSRIRTGKFALKIEKIPLSPILSEQAISSSSTTDKHNFVLDIAPDLSEVFVDRSKFSQILANLLSNAVKYSPKGGRITLSARNDSPENRVIVSVADEGLGISPADKETLFQTFHRIQRQETISIRGIGLGLYIVKEWTEAMGGTVWLESELNKGTTFFIALPTRLQEKPVHTF